MVYKEQKAQDMGLHGTGQLDCNACKDDDDWPGDRWNKAEGTVTRMTQEGGTGVPSCPNGCMIVHSNLTILCQERPSFLSAAIVGNLWEVVVPPHSAPPDP